MTAVDQLFGRRTVLVASVLDDETASRVAAELMTLDALCDDPIDLWINCSGGAIATPALPARYDAIAMRFFGYAWA